MPHIDLPEGIPGIRSAMAFRPETAGPLLQLADVLLRGDNTLSRGERELIAAPTDPDAHDAIGRRIVDHGYLHPVAAAAPSGN